MLILHHMHEYQTLFNNIKYNSFPFLFFVLCVCVCARAGLHYTHIENGIFHSRSRHHSRVQSSHLLSIYRSCSCFPSEYYHVYFPFSSYFLRAFSYIFECYFFLACFLRIHFVMIDGRYQNQVKYEVYILQFRIGSQSICMKKKREKHSIKIMRFTGCHCFFGNFFSPFFLCFFYLFSFLLSIGIIPKKKWKKVAMQRMEKKGKRRFFCSPLFTLDSIVIFFRFGLPLFSGSVRK